MKLTQITVSYGETQSLPDYCNIKPQLTLTAVLDDADDPQGVELYLWEQAKAAVHAQVDAALEANDRPAKHDPGPRYQVLRTYWDRYYDRGTPEPPRLVVIFPSGARLKQHNGTKLVHAGNVSDSSRLRYAHALRVAAQSADDIEATVIDCSDGDLSRLDAALPPPTPEQLAEATAARTAPEHLEDTLDYGEHDDEELEAQDDE